MKYPCGMIQDLLPLYADGVCSEESKNAVEQHLSECATCKEIYLSMCNSDNKEIETQKAEYECMKASSFKAVKKKLFIKQILVACIAVAIVIAIAFATIGFLRNSTQIVEYNNNISVAMIDGNLTGRLRESTANHVKIKNVTRIVDGEEEICLFFYVSETKWDALTTNSKAISEFTLCPSDKSADKIDAVYYFTGDYSGIESMNSEELNEVIDASQLVWEK